MTSVFILNKITGKNYDFFELGHFSYFLGCRGLHKFSAMPISSQ